MLSRNVQQNKIKQLWAAVLLQTIHDITDIKGKKESNQRHYRRQSLAWVMSKSEGFHSFIGVCWTLQIDPTFTREKILSMPRAVV